MAAHHIYGEIIRAVIRLRTSRRCLNSRTGKRCCGHHQIYWDRSYVAAGILDPNINIPTSRDFRASRRGLANDIAIATVAADRSPISEVRHQIATVVRKNGDGIAYRHSDCGRVVDNLKTDAIGVLTSVGICDNHSIRYNNAAKAYTGNGGISFVAAVFPSPNVGVRPRTASHSAGNDIILLGTL